MDETKPIKSKRSAQKQVSSSKKYKKFIKPLVYTLSGIFCLSISIVLINIYVHYRFNQTRVNDLSREISNLKSAMNIDSVRQYQLQKVLRIIDKRNPELSSVDAYDIANQIYEMSVKYTNLDVDLLCAVITHESAGTWNPKIISPAGAMGLMQIMPVTGMFLANYEGLAWTTPEDILYNPAYNIRLGSRFLSTLIQKYNLDGALAAYNAGEKVAAVWLANGKDDKFLWEETRGYIPAIQQLYEDYLSENM